MSVGESVAFIGQSVLLGFFISWLEDHAGRTDRESYVPPRSSID
jgi:hypothetical protein